MAIQRSGSRSSADEDSTSAGSAVRLLMSMSGWMKRLNSTRPSAPCVDEPRGLVAQRAVVGTDLDGKRDREGRLDQGNQLYLLVLDLPPRQVDIGGDAIEVELERVGAGELKQSRVPHPATRGLPVQAGHHGDRQGLLRLLDMADVAVDDRLMGLSVGEVAGGFRIAAGTHVAQAGGVDVLVLHLLLEQRRQHDGGDTGLLKGTQRVDPGGQRS